MVINETVPANTTFNAAASSAGGGCADGAPAGTICTFTLGSLAAGVRLVHSPQQHYQAANLDGWYPRIAELTARSRWYETPPAPEEVERDFTYPIFIRGAFQTNHHKAASSVVHSREEYRR